MIEALIVAAVLSLQDPKPAKTVEERIKELSEKIERLDKKASDLLVENASLEQKVAAMQTWREKVPFQVADIWMKRHAGGLSLADAQSKDIHALWVTWTRTDFQKPADIDQWKAREATLRAALTPEQAVLLEKSVRAEIDAAADHSIRSYGNQAGIALDHADAFAGTVRKRLTLVEAGLIPQAHEGAGVSWSGLYSAVEASLPDLADVLTPGERDRVAKLLAQRSSRKPKEK